MGEIAPLFACKNVFELAIIWRLKHQNAIFLHALGTFLPFLSPSKKKIFQHPPKNDFVGDAATVL